MADGFDIHLNEDQAQRLKSAAEASGIDPTVYALQVLEQAMEDDWAEDFRRIAEYKRTGESIGAEEWMQGLREAVHAKSSLMQADQECGGVQASVGRR